MFGYRLHGCRNPARQEHSLQPSFAARSFGNYVSGPGWFEAHDGSRGSFSGLACSSLNTPFIALPPVA